jgi:predicted carbohydrate-binding protein with CBM5 and CBM33 domain
VTARIAVVALALLALGAAEARAHGTSMSPASRVYVCRYLDRTSEPCAHAWQRNPQAIYDWMAVSSPAPTAAIGSSSPTASCARPATRSTPRSTVRERAG